MGKVPLGQLSPLALTSMGRRVAEQGLQQESIRDRVSHLRAKFRGKRIIVGVDRLDYIKGTSLSVVVRRRQCPPRAHIHADPAFCVVAAWL